MTDLLLPGGILVASLTLTYFLCLRPMRRGQCAHRGTRPSPDVAMDAALWRARAELDRLRAAGASNDTGGSDKGRS